MRPVNLLPARHRPRSGAGGESKNSYIALGVLGLLVLAVFGYVMTANKVSSTKSEIAQVQQQISAAETQTVTLSDFGSFATIKQARLSAVRSLATSRLDWERLFRELAHVLPEGVWLTGFDGQSAATDDSAGGGTTAPVGSALMLEGCANSHRQIADVMVRLRELNVAEDVELTKTAAATGDAASGAASTGSASDPECGRFYSFEVRITMAAPAPELGGGRTEPVPARLGGGS
jgi:Tfp pilus assembly protein PilN